MEDDAGSGEMEGGADSAEGGPGATGAGTAPGLTDVEGKGTGLSMRTEQTSSAQSSTRATFSTLPSSVTVRELDHAMAGHAIGPEHPAVPAASSSATASFAIPSFTVASMAPA